MSPRRALYELPYVPPHGRTPAFTGMVLFVVIEATALFSVLSSYFYLGVMTGPWPPPSVPPPDLGVPSAGVLAILVSAVLARVLERRLRARPRAFWLALPLGLLLVTGYVASSVVTLRGRSYTWADHAYGSISWLSDGTSLLHVLGLLGIGVFVLLTSWREPAAHLSKVRVLAAYWYFVAFTAVANWAVLYVFPVLAGGIA
jgi:cytochrome c oxidase subunit III